MEKKIQVQTLSLQALSWESQIDDNLFYLPYRYTRSNTR